MKNVKFVPYKVMNLCERSHLLYKYLSFYDNVCNKINID